MPKVEIVVELDAPFASEAPQMPFAPGATMLLWILSKRIGFGSTSRSARLMPYCPPFEQHVVVDLIAVAAVDHDVGDAAALDLVADDMARR